MKKIRLLLICALLIAAASLMSAGCSKSEKISSVSIKDHDPEEAIEMLIGNFDYGAYTLVVTYDSGKIEEIPLTEAMIADADLFKFYQEGEHTITVSHGDKTYEFRISVKRSTFESISFPEDNVFTYDGEPHTVEIDGDIPANAVVTYPGGNSFINAGTYDVTAIVTCEGYVTEKLSTTVKIERATYDTDSLQFEKEEFVVVYDGELHSAKLLGTLPEGVSEPTYLINGNKIQGVADVGEYTVLAVFANNNPNYETIPDRETTLKIIPAEYDMPEVDIIFKTQDGDPIESAQKVYDATDVLFDIENREYLSSKLNIAFTVSDANGNVISNSNKETNIRNAGIYTVKAEFSLGNNKNYKAIEPIVRTFEIKKAKYEVSLEKCFGSDIVIFDGEAHSLTVILPSGLNISPEDITYRYYLAGELLPIENNMGVVDVGEYTVIATFSVNDENYEQIPDMQAILRIEKNILEASSLVFGSDTQLIYTGESQMVEFSGFSLNYLKCETVIYKIDGETSTIVAEAREIGYYSCVITVSIKDTDNCVFSNEETSVEYTCMFEILELEEYE